MARTAVLSKDQILESSFKMVNELGLDKVTIRSIANDLGTSTAPIYTQYKKMDEIKEDLSRYVKKQLMLHLEGHYTENPFLNIGVGLLTFAYNNQKVFQTYYLTKSPLASYMTKNNMQFIEYMKTDSFLALLDEERLRSLMNDMWIYTFGLATIICTNEAVDSLQNYLDQLKSTGDRLITYHLFSSGNIENCFALIGKRIHNFPKANTNK